MGTVEAYEESAVLRRLSAGGTLVAQTPELAEVYQDGDRYWLVDDRWGVCEMNLLKASWRSWVIPSPKLEPFRCVEMAILWPMAQLLRARGVHLVPATSVVRDGWGALLISPFSLEPELKAMLRVGYRLIGQRWTAIREENGAAVLLHVPGKTEQRGVPRLSAGSALSDSWADLCDGRPGAVGDRAICRAVFAAEHGRRPKAYLREMNPTNAAALLRRSWPIPDLHPQRRHSPVTARLAETCRCCDIQLSRNPKDFLALLQAVSLPVTAAVA